MIKILLVSVLAALPAHNPGAVPLNGIEGKVTIKERRLQRVANPYAGSGPAAAREVKPLPAIVFLNGAVGTTSAAARKPELAQRDTAFEPELMVVPVGTAVGFPNQDAFFHNVFSYSKAKRFDLGRYPRGESKTIVFDQPGTISIFCEIHKWMRAGIVVVENQYHAVVRADGSFSLPGVPPGNYALTVWQAERGSRTVAVTVPATGPARVDVSF